MTTQPPTTTPTVCTCAVQDNTGPTLDPHADDCARKVAFREALTKAFMITDTRALCGLHRLPFREKWPTGVATFGVEALRALTPLPAIWDEARELAGIAADEVITLKALEAVFDKRPMCCRVSPEKLVELYVASKIGQVKICTNCSRFAKGTPIETVKQGRIEHLCFVCMSHSSTSSQEVH